MSKRRKTLSSGSAAPLIPTENTEDIIQRMGFARATHLDRGGGGGHQQQGQLTLKSIFPVIYRLLLLFVKK